MISTAIKQARLKMGLTLKELGTRVGLSESAIARYESGDRIPDESALNRLCQVLELDSLTTPDGGIVFYPTPSQWEKLKQDPRTAQTVINDLLDDFYDLGDRLSLQRRLITAISLMEFVENEPRGSYRTFARKGEPIAIAFLANPRNKHLIVYSPIKSGHVAMSRFQRRLWPQEITCFDELNNFVEELAQCLS